MTHLPVRELHDVGHETEHNSHLNTVEEIHEPAVDITRCDCEYGTDKDGPEKVKEPGRMVVSANVGGRRVKGKQEKQSRA